MLRTCFFSLLPVLLLVSLNWASSTRHYLPEIYNQTLVLNLSVAGGSIGGHGDWVAFDCDTNTVWLAHGPGQNVVVLDALTNSVRLIIPSVVAPNGITFSPLFAFVADNEAGTINVYNKYNYALLQVLNTPGGPDGVYWDSVRRSVWVALDDISRVLEFTLLNDKQFRPLPVTNLSLSTPVAAVNTSGPDIGVLVPQLQRLYQPIDNVINVINVVTKKIEHVWTLPFVGAAKGISFDSSTGNLLVGTNHNVSFIVSNTGRVLATFPLPGGVDETVVLSETRRGYLGDKAGYIDVIDLDNYSLLQRIPTALNAHTFTAINFPAFTKVISYFDRLNLVGFYEWKQE